MRTGGKINMNKNSKKYILLKLFFTTIYISTFTFGGGFVIITFMKKKFVDELHWITWLGRPQKIYNHGGR